MMNFTHQQKQFVYLIFIFITQTTSRSIRDLSHTKLCNWSEENCTLYQHHPFHFKSSPVLITREYPSTTTTPEYNKRNPYSISFKYIGIIAASIIVIFIIIRVCLIVYKSSSDSSNNRLSHRRLNSVRPQIATIERNSFKPDLPPAYNEAIASIDNAESKLPSYDELNYEQPTRDVNRTQM